MNKEETQGDSTHEEILAGYEKELRQIQSQKGLDHLDVANMLSQIGGIHWEMGNYSKAVDHGKQALEIIDKALGSDHTHTITSVENLISGLIAIKHYSQAQAMRDKYLGYLTEEHPRYAYFHALENYIAKESSKAGFRPPSVKKKNKNKKRKRKKG